MKTPFYFETMDVYRVAVDAARAVRQTNFGTGNADLRNQAVRASQSVVLNLAEGNGLSGGNRRRHYRIAPGSAGEVVAAFDLLELDQGPAIQELYRRVGAMLRKLAGPG